MQSFRSGLPSPRQKSARRGLSTSLGPLRGALRRSRDEAPPEAPPAVPAEAAAAAPPPPPLCWLLSVFMASAAPSAVCHALDRGRPALPLLPRLPPPGPEPEIAFRKKQSYQTKC
ncbi:hypothetical protein HPB50_024932 [Hyalomma asiaticum]|uniref:Uncharacterized protein n=1 Tax=Hyalomma asiaticum TaxID=266040 RepID=A0ACB7RMV9_HYAAI|nr:hypothetical protein HPB50_024932 [Hyalomma asiaticum]